MIGIFWLTQVSRRSIMDRGRNINFATRHKTIPSTFDYYEFLQLQEAFCNIQVNHVLVILIGFAFNS